MRVLAPVLAAVAVLAFAAPAHAAPKVAVVDLVRVMSKHKSSKEIEKRFKDQLDEAKADFNRQQERLDKLKMELDKMLENDPDRPLKEKQYLLQLNAMKFNRQWAVQEAEREYVRALERLHSAMKALVAAYAKENGIEVVMLSTESDGPMHAETRQDFDLRSRLRGVVYAAPTVDITDAIIARIPENERIK